MTGKILLLGVFHATEADQWGGTQLMGPASLRIFRERIRPQLTDNSLILLEGPSWKSLIRPGNQLYPLVLQREFGPLACTPNFGAFDPRHQKSPRKSRQMLAGGKEWNRVSTDLLAESEDIPATFKEATERLIASQYELALRQQPTKYEIQLARWAHGLMLEFDRRYISALEHHAPHHDLSIMVSGTSHTLSMARKTGWEYEILGEENQKQVTKLWNGYRDYIALPEALVKQDQANAA